MVSSILGPMRGIFLLLILTILIFVVNMVQMVSVVIYPFSRRKFMLFNMATKQFYCDFLVKCCYACGNDFQLTGDLAQRENAIVLGNHQSYIDVPVLWMWASPLKTIGWMKWFVKDEFKFVPGLGWGLKFVQGIFVKRNWSRDADSIKETFKILMGADIPFWITIFPEGTRMKAKKYSASQLYSKRRGSTVFQHVLFPRPKGVWASIQGVKSKLSAVYDFSIAFPCEPPTVFEYFCKGHYTVKLDIKRFPIAELPTTEREFNQWMQDRFEAKDRWLAANSGWVHKFNN